MKDERWVSICGQRQRVSELPYELKEKLGLLNDEVEEKPTERKTVATKVRSSPRVRERIIYVPIPTKEHVRSKDSGADIIAKCVGRSLGRLYGRFKYG